MPVALSARIIDALLLGQGDRRRQLQSFPILVDVWTLFAEAPGILHDLLVTPHHDVPASRVGDYLDEMTHHFGKDGRDRAVAQLQGLVAVRVSLQELWTTVLPATSWWASLRAEIDGPADQGRLDDLEGGIAALLEAEAENEGRLAIRDAAMIRSSDRIRGGRSAAERQLIRLGLLMGCLAAAEAAEGEPLRSIAAMRERLGTASVAMLGREAIQSCWRHGEENKALDWLIDRHSERGLIFNVSANRQAEYAVSRSVPAIKADAARQLFSISCADIGWAILDSGIDETHPAFAILDAAGKAIGNRVVATYDFGDVRAILSRTNLYNTNIRKQLAERLFDQAAGSVEDIDARILALAKNAAEGQPIDWPLAEPLIARKHPVTPEHPHGTHVAGILGGNWDGTGNGASAVIGVCPDIRLFDLRVLGPSAEQTEFAVIAALQFVRHLNSRNGRSIIDGVNLSLSIPHNVRNYACGRTPVCMEAEALAAVGTVVVAAAGNHGYQSFRLADDSSFESYAASSITDPGNADAVITVGATHRYWPHTYGVSFFSSRGPTGDGRMKPDVLAPGERIESAVPGPSTDAMDGTSMAAPHVSGAAALLIARHRELKGRPARIKEILCATATDLGRERSFQGHGMIDVLRAIQSV
jgi:hypothetical protein